MKITNKTRVSVRRLNTMIFFSILLSIVFCGCGATEIKRMDTEPTANINVDRSNEETTTVVTTTFIPATTTIVTSNSKFTTTAFQVAQASLTTLETTTTTTVAEKIIQETPVQNNENVVTEISAETSSEEFIGTFSRGTFYTTGSYGGSGRNLVSGYSIASRAIYETYGYGDYKIRIECEDFPELNGIYSLDDCSAPGNYEVIDFWFLPKDVPSYFKEMGVFEVKAYIIY